MTLYLSVHDHAITVRSAVLFTRDAQFSESSRRGAQKWLDSLLNDYCFDDNYAIKTTWASIMDGQIYEQ